MDTPARDSQTITSPNINKVNNFSTIRLYLAMCVVVAHFNTLFGDSIFWLGTSSMAVKSFFVLSGFLVTYSFLNSTNLKNYMVKRARRIFPSYLAVVLLCAFLLVFVSQLSFSDYFTSRDWWRYLLSNITTLNFMHPALPGVFGEGAVNGSLWTIKVELSCYLMIPLFIFMCSNKRSRIACIFGLTIALSILFSYYAFEQYSRTGSEKWLIIERQVFGQIAYFFCGSLFCIFFERLKGQMKILLIGGAVLLLLSLMLEGFGPLLKPFAYTFFFIPLAFIGKWGNLAVPFDFSYELYLVHFPIINLVLHFSAHETIGIVGAFLLSVVLSLVGAFILWNLIGRKFLRRSAPRLSRQPV